jgi:hypothetical protein
VITRILILSAGAFGLFPDDPLMFGYCCTQLTDVYQKQKDVYTFDCQSKFDLERLRQTQQRHAAIEHEK